MAPETQRRLALLHRRSLHGARTAAPCQQAAIEGARLTAEWENEYARWQRRDLSARRYVYIWADGVYLQARTEAQAECILVIIGATPEGKKELVGFHVGTRESAQSWRELLVDLKVRGLAVAPEMAVGDGALGFWKALNEVFPGTCHQRCWVHKVSNVLGKFPKGRALLRVPQEYLDWPRALSRTAGFSWSRTNSSSRRTSRWR